jgi:hypothetical protein
MVNLFADDPHTAWREMMVTCDVGDDLKRRAGLSLGGRKNDKPV